MQGQSIGTIDKVRKIGSSLWLSMTAANNAAKRLWKPRRYHYFHFDANAGCGWNDIADCAGSPVVFATLARELLTHMDPQAILCDICPDTIADLRKRLSGQGLTSPAITIEAGDNARWLQMFAADIRARENPQKAVGTLLLDPNGYLYRRQDGIGVPPVDELISFVHEFPRIDVILNLNLRVYRQARGWAQKGRAVFDWPTPEEVLRSLNRKHWLVSITGKQRHQFFLAVGRNERFGEHRRLGLVHWDTPMGRYVLACAASNRQSKLKLDLPPLPPLPPPSANLPLFGDSA